MNQAAWQAEPSVSGPPVAMVGKWELCLVVALGLLLFGERLPVIGPFTYRLFRNTWFYRVYRPWFERYRTWIGGAVFVVMLVLVYWIRWHTRP